MTPFFAHQKMYAPKFTERVAIQRGRHNIGAEIYALRQKFSYWANKHELSAVTLLDAPRFSLNLLPPRKPSAIARGEGALSLTSRNTALRR